MKCTILLHSNLRYYEMIAYGIEFLSYIVEYVHDEVICLQHIQQHFIVWKKEFWKFLELDIDKKNLKRIHDFETKE